VYARACTGELYWKSRVPTGLHLFAQPAQIFRSFSSLLKSDVRQNSHICFESEGFVHGSSMKIGLALPMLREDNASAKRIRCRLK